MVQRPHSSWHHESLTSSSCMWHFNHETRSLQMRTRLAAMIHHILHWDSPSHTLRSWCVFLISHEFCVTVTHARVILTTSGPEQKGSIFSIVDAKVYIGLPCVGYIHATSRGGLELRASVVVRSLCFFFFFLFHCPKSGHRHSQWVCCRCK